MDPAAWRCSVRRRSLAGGEVHVEDWKLGRRRVEELEAAVARLRAEKEAAARAAAALQAELESEQGAAETAASEALLMIGRLQREKAVAMIEAREFRRIAQSRAGRVRELHDQLADVYALAASYQELLRAHGINTDEEESESDHHEERAVEARENGHYTEAKEVVIEEPSPSPSPPPAAEEFEDKYAVDVSCAAVTKPVAEERVADVAGDLCARVEALEADSAAVRREVAALRAQVVLAQRLCRDAAAEKQRFSVLAIFKWFFSTILWGMKRSASAARKLPNISSSTPYFLLGLLPLMERSKGTLQIQSKTSRQPVHSHGLEYLMLCYSFH